MSTGRACPYGGVMPVRVVLAEDHQIIREGLRAVLMAAPEIELLGTYADYDELLPRWTNTFRTSSSPTSGCHRA